MGEGVLILIIYSNGLVFLPLLYGAAAGIAVNIVFGIIDAFLDEDTVSEEVRNQCPEALKILIEKKDKAVNVGIFSDETTLIQDDVEIQTTKGVSDNLYVGQEIYL